MIGLDTNVLLAWVLSGQSRPLPPASSYRLSIIVLAELVWVLGKQLKHPRDFILHVLEELLENADIVVDRRDVVTQALADYRSGPADFADYFIGRDNRSSGCRTTVTFDKDAGRHPPSRFFSSNQDAAPCPPASRALPMPTCSDPPSATKSGSPTPN